MLFPSRNRQPDPVRAKRKLKRRLIAGGVGATAAVVLFDTPAYEKDTTTDVETL